MAGKETFITTVDNPFDYFTQFEDWLNYDRLMGYYTCEYVGRLAKLAPDISEEDEYLELNRVFDSIIEWNGGMYKKVFKE